MPTSSGAGGRSPSWIADAITATTGIPSALSPVIPAEAFHTAYFGPSRASARLRHAVQVNLLTTLARTNRALTRLMSLEQLSSPNRPDAALEAAYHAQLATASPL